MRRQMRKALTILLLFGAAMAPSAQVRFEAFSLADFDYVIDIALDEYIDPDDVDVSRAYVGAAGAALASLPYPLLIYPRGFFEQRGRLLAPERVVPGRGVLISPTDEFILLEPDYESWDALTEEARTRAAERRREMSAEELVAELERQTKLLRIERDASESAWAATEFRRSDFLEVIGWVERNLYRYVEPPPSRAVERGDSFEMPDVFFSAADGFVGSFDPHSNVQKVEIWDQIRSESQDSSYEGIGALLRGGGTDGVIVETPLADSPALASGLRAGDIIRRVNDESVEGLSLNEVVDRILGPRGTIVELHVERPPLMDLRLIRIVRGLIEQKAVSHHYIAEEKVGVITVSSFLYEEEGSETSTMVMEAYFDLLDESADQMEALVLDLRNNGGGFLLEAVAVAGLFLEPNAIVVQRTTYAGGLKPYRNPLYPIEETMPLAVLINAGSASASEIVASALMDYNRALILGDRSYGKATIQEIFTLGDIILKVTTGRYYAPRGYTLQIAGVTPDIAVSDQVDGGFPKNSYREEDMWRSLPQLDLRGEDPMRDRWVAALEEMAGENIDAYLDLRAGEAMSPDYMLYRAVGYLDALKRLPSPVMILPEPQPIG